MADDNDFTKIAEFWDPKLPKEVKQNILDGLVRKLEAMPRDKALQAIADLKERSIFTDMPELNALEAKLNEQTKVSK